MVIRKMHTKVNQTSLVACTVCVWSAGIESCADMGLGKSGMTRVHTPCRAETYNARLTRRVGADECAITPQCPNGGQQFDSTPCVICNGDKPRETAEPREAWPDRAKEELFEVEVERLVLGGLTLALIYVVVATADSSCQRHVPAGMRPCVCVSMHI